MVIGKLETILVLLGIVAVLSVLAARIRFPFPIMMVLGGVGIALVPGLPVVTMDPELVLLVFLPPILYSAAFNFPWDELRRNLRPILLMATGLVFATLVSVALAAHWLIPGMGLAAAFVLGAIVSPPDAAAATAIFKRLRVPQRMLTVLEGESLVNDASGLVAYSFAVAAVVTGTFSLGEAALDFVWISLGGVGFGLLVAWVVGKIHRRLDDPSTGITLEILTPYIAYLPADQIGVSGVLAAVAAGLSVGNRAAQLMNPVTRIQGAAIWSFLNFFLNGTIFILIGLEFPLIMHELRHTPVWHLAGYAAAISLVVIAVRFVWIFVAAWLGDRVLPPLENQIERPRGALVVMSWAGMRGAVSLAAALAIPLVVADGSAFPQRDLIVFLTYCVIFVTLVFQGFTLPWVVRRSGLEETVSEAAIEHEARLILLGEAVERIDAELKRPNSPVQEATLRVLREHFQTRQDHLEWRGTVRDLEPADIQGDLRFLVGISDAMRRRLALLRNDGVITDTVRRLIEYDIDTDEQRLRRLFFGRAK